MPEKTRVMSFSPLSNRRVQEWAGRGAALRAQALAAPAGPRPREPGGEGHGAQDSRSKGRHYTLSHGRDDLDLDSLLLARPPRSAPAGVAGRGARRRGQAAAREVSAARLRRR